MSLVFEGNTFDQLKRERVVGRREKNLNLRLMDGRKRKKRLPERLERQAKCQVVSRKPFEEATQGEQSVLKDQEES